MEISEGMIAIDTALYWQSQKTLIINDLHIGYEEALHRKGFLVPKFQVEQIIVHLQKILRKVHPETIIINGDLKHEFGKVLRQEWQGVLKLIDFLKKNCKKIIVIRGNHDPILQPVVEKRGVVVVAEYQQEDTLVVHGDVLVETNAKRIIIGHEHPAVTVREGSKWEKYKCFLRGKWQRKELLVLPSFNPLLEGTDILKERLLSPFLKDIKTFSVFIVSEHEILPFGNVSDVPS